LNELEVMLLSNSHYTDVEKMVMNIRYDFYEFLVMLFGLCNAPSAFITFMNYIFHDKLDKFIIIYIDG
jgi:hypothetical protein